MTMVHTMERGGSLRSLLGRPFYLIMALIIATVVAYGFSHTIDRNLIHPAVPKPFILYLHAATFSGWLVLFLTQTSLVWSRNVSWHKRVGLFGVALGAAIPVIGVATAIVMAKFEVAHGARDTAPFLAIPFNDMIVFVVCFALAVAWRRWPEYHRRLMLVATCGLTAAGFGRFPMIPHDWFYAGVDVLILLGVMRDLMVMKRVHPVYLWALPSMIAGQLIAMSIYIGQPSWWMTFAHTLMQ
jgi:hypothetical protein